MAERIYDAVIVEARCAGAALATYLARSGATVTALEADRQIANNVASLGINAGTTGI
jgi:choline dehydrogenase-like flavoprotein